MRRIVAVSAGLWSPSKTTALAQAILDKAGERLGGTAELLELGPAAADLGRTLTRDAAPPEVARIITAIEKADVLIAATPVFRGSYTGHFKHLFDLIAVDSLRALPVILAVTGGGEKHCLVLEYALRPLFGFFQAFAVPTGIYATERDFAGGALHSSPVAARIATAVDEVQQLVGPSLPLRETNLQCNPRALSTDRTV